MYPCEVKSNMVWLVKYQLQTSTCHALPEPQFGQFGFSPGVQFLGGLIVLAIFMDALSKPRDCAGAKGPGSPDRVKTVMIDGKMPVPWKARFTYYIDGH